VASVLTVACVYRPGGGFSNEYVRSLQRAVGRHCHAPHRFVCLTQQTIAGVETVPLVRNWHGWWSKLELFRRGLFDGPVFYLDLDTVIVGDCTDILTAEYEFACGAGWKTTGDGESVLASGIMAWDGRLDLSHVFEQFTPAAIPKYESWPRWGDQGWIQDTLGRPFENITKRWPGRILHAKTHVFGGTKNHNAAPPLGASIVCFSGRPRPHQLPPTAPLYKQWVA